MVRAMRAAFTSSSFAVSSLVALLVTAACSSSSSTSPSSPVDGGADTSTVTPTDGGGGTGDGGGVGDAATADDGGIGGARPVDVHVPPSYVAGTPMPLVLLLHGYSVTGKIEELYLNLTALADTKGFLYAHPDGLVDTQGNQYWNATDACCDLGGTGVDDSAYLSKVITQIQAKYSVDPKRIFLFGHSNGAFMSYRMACDHADQIAAIVSLAGAMYSDVSKCTPKASVSILEVHGTADQTIDFNGGQIQGHAYPSAATTVGDWVTFDGCGATADTSAPPLDLDTGLAGAETTVTKYAAGCKPGGHAELWTITGGAHIPQFNPSFSAGAIDFLFAHPKP
jgi:polyhydroxybutyrate depolymerase